LAEDEPLVNPFLYLVGGPMRTGKSIIARRFNEQTGVSAISTDHIVSMLMAGLPKLGLDLSRDGWKDSKTRAERVAPMVEAHAASIEWELRPWLIEGELLPDSVRRIQGRIGSRTRVCFIGDIETTVEAKARRLREHGEFDRLDWLRGRSQAYMLDIATRVLAASREYQAAADRLDVPFFDMAPDFNASMERVLTYLTSGRLEL
jgi:hypothetical protein